jgi:hypothetical protein
MSRYKAMYTKNDVKKNLGYAYKDRILISNTRPRLYNNARLLGFAVIIEDMIYLWFNMTKKIKLFVNYNLPKDTEDIN